MQAHITGTGKRERRSKGRNRKPEIYLSIEILLLALLVFLISFANIKLLTVISAVAAIFIVLMSCIPRYKKIVARQVAHKVYNYEKHH